VVDPRVGGESVMPRARVSQPCGSFTTVRIRSPKHGVGRLQLRAQGPAPSRSEWHPTGAHATPQPIQPVCRMHVPRAGAVGTPSRRGSLDRSHGSRPCCQGLGLYCGQASAPRCPELRGTPPPRLKGDGELGWGVRLLEVKQRPEGHDRQFDENSVHARHNQHTYVLALQQVRRSTGERVT
jgi:hypothetical protein